MTTLTTKRLVGRYIQLEVMVDSHSHGLYEAAHDIAIWTSTSSVAYGDKFKPWFKKAIDSFQKSQHLPFVVRRLSDNKIIGSTRFYDINLEHKRVPIGYTWFIPEVWGMYVNPECKLLMLTFAFETLQCNRVEFMTDLRNTRSRAAIKKLGAVEEGVLRNHMILTDGHLRDSVVFSIIKPEWESIQANLLARISKINNI